MADSYPKRPPFFAYRFCRLMAKVCLANEIGPEACWLLTVVAHTEDAKGYRGPVTFFNSQLMPIVGVASEETLLRLRTKAIRVGWLAYRPGGKGRAGRYWVNVPERFEGVDDAPSDERPAKYFAENTPKNEGTTEGQREGIHGGMSGVSQGDNEGATAEHSSLTLTPTRTQEVPPPAKRRRKAADEPAKARPINPMFEVIAEMSGADRKRQGGRIGMIAAAISEAGVTPEECRDRLPEVVRKYAPYRTSLDLNTIQECWPWIKTPPVTTGAVKSTRGDQRTEYAKATLLDALGAEGQSHGGVP